MAEEAEGAPPVGRAAAEGGADLSASGENDRPVFLPRRTLSVGAVGRGEGQRRFKILTPLDRGGMGELFLAEVTEPGQAPRFAVLKRLLADLIDDKKYVSMFLTEARVMSRLSHPHIVRVIDSPQIDGAQCLAMEFVHGKNVQQILSRAHELGQKIPGQIVLRVMTQVLRALDYAHGFKLEDGTPLNLVHRDVTPGNVLVSFDGEVKLTDFGIAKSEMSAVSTTVGIVKGKARYLAPEQILGEQASPRSDIFSTAAVVLEMVTGSPLFDRGSVPKTLYAIVHGERPEVESMLSFRAPLLVQLLNRALAIDPRQRVQSAREMAEGMESAARFLGKPADAQIVGAWLRELFQGQPDPLARYVLAPRPPPEPDFLLETERPTVHIYAPESRVEAVAPGEPIDDPLTVQATPLAVEAPATRPEVRATRGAELSQPAALPMAAQGEAMSGRPTAVERPPSMDTRVESDTPGVGADPRRAPTQVIRGVAPARPAAADHAVPTSEEPEPAGQEEATLAASVEEALSALALIQAEKRRGEGERSPTLVRRPPEEPRRAAPTLISRSGLTRGVLAALFAGGAAFGVLGTLLVQASLPEKEPPPSLSDEELALEPEEEAAALEVLEPVGGATLAAITAAAPPPAGAREGQGEIDLLEPRGARVRLNGVWLRERVPLKAFPVKAGRHQLRLQKGKKSKDVAFTIEDGERLDLTRRLLRRAHP